MRAASTDAPRTTTLAAILAPGANSFGVIRLAMAVAVLFSHSFWFVTGSSANEPLHAITGFSLGEHAVQVFFLLSGVLVAQSFDKSRSVIDFAIARTLRIFPGLFVCVIATALALGLVVTVLTPQDFIAHPGLKAYLAKTLTLVSGSASLPGVFETLPVPGLFNGSLWTLKYEVICYAGLAALGALSLFEPRLRALSIAIVALFAVGCAALLPAGPHAGYAAAQNIAYFAVYFATGVLAYLVRERVFIHWTLTALLLGAAALAIATPWQNIATAVALGYATLFFGSLTYGRLTKWTRAHDLSFGIYIYAAPIQQTLIQLHPGIDPYTVSAAALLIALPCAHVSWNWIEAPALSWRRPLVSMFRPARQPVAPEPERLAKEFAAAAPPMPPARFGGADLNRRMGRAAPLARHARGSLRVSPARSVPRYRG